MVSFILQVDPFSSVSAAHGVGENVRHQIHKSHPEVSEVFIHIGVFPGLWSHIIFVIVLDNLEWSYF